MLSVEPALDRADFLKLVPAGVSALEIGPFAQPTFRHEKVRYFDVLDADALRARARVHGLNPDNVPSTIHFVSPTGDLSIARDTFSFVFSSHCIEHQPDLVRHLQQVEALLAPGGSYYLVVPDARYCFDHFLPLTTIGDVLGAHHERRQKHSLVNLVQHRAMTTHNDSHRHWIGDHGFVELDAAKVAAAVREYETAEGYVDVHAWKFNPEGFLAIFQCLYQMGLTKLRPVRVFDTPVGIFEFYVVLTKR
jgi:SAM-dependent methyltransferase